jgi:osmotically inducible protein OsmC
MQRSATAVWNGALKDGRGKISTESGVFTDAPYSFVTRFENGKGTNPEELIAAAHAGCFTMALAAQLGTINVTPESLHAVVTVSLENSMPAGRFRAFILKSPQRFPAFLRPRLKRQQRARKQIAPFRVC